MNYLLVDGNSLGYYHQQSDKLHNGEMEVQAVFGFVKNVRRYASILHARPMILWDGFSDKRRDYYPEYKANRDEDPEMKKMKEGFAVQKPYILKMMAALGVNQLIAKDAEADDLAGMLVGRLAPQPTVDHIYLLTGDGDWLQLVREKVSWVSLREDAKQKQVNFEQFPELIGLPTPRAFLEAKALQGDTSDNIKGVGGIGDGGAKELLHEWGSVAAMVRGINDGSIVINKGRYKTAFNKLAKNAFNEKTGCRMLEAFKRNMTLMNLIDTKFPPSEIEKIKGARDLKAFELLCHELNFRSFLEDLDVFVLPFERYC